MAQLSETLLAQFKHWLDEAGGTEPNDPNAMALATAGASGMPSVRMVLLKDVTAEGFVFYTNKESRKGQALADNPQASILFHWKSLRRQVRVEGHISHVDEETAQAYFDSRPRLSRIGAWASDQSRPMTERLEFEQRIAKYTAKYAVGSIPKPPHWGGYLLDPVRIEFWQDRAHRLHDRDVYSADGSGGDWVHERLYP